jgi:hypothetical protein
MRSLFVNLCWLVPRLARFFPLNQREAPSCNPHKLWSTILMRARAEPVTFVGSLETLPKVFFGCSVCVCVCQNVSAFGAVIHTTPKDVTTATGERVGFADDFRQRVSSFAPPTSAEINQSSILCNWLSRELQV